MKCTPWGKPVTCHVHNEHLHNLSSPLTSVRLKVTRLRSDCSFSWIIPALSVFTHILTCFALFAHIVCQRPNESRYLANESVSHLVMLSSTPIFPGAFFFFLNISRKALHMALTNNHKREENLKGIRKMLFITFVGVFRLCWLWWGMRNGLLWL